MGVDTPLFDGMLVPQHVPDDVANDVANVIADADAKPTLLSPTPATTPPTQQELIPSFSQVESTPPPSPHQSPIAQLSSPPPQQTPSHNAKISIDLLNQLLETWEEGGGIAKLDADEDVTLEEVAAEVAKDADVKGRLEESQAHVYHLDIEHAQKVLKVVTATAATTITAAPMPKANAARRRKGVVIRDPEETTTPLDIVHSKPKSRERKSKTVMRYQTLKRKPQTEAHARKNMMVYLKNMAGFKMDFFKEELKTYLQIVPHYKDDVYTETTPLALKVPVVDYQIHTEHNKPDYKIIRADGTHQLFLSFISLLRNFDIEDLEMMWKIVQEIFASSEPKNFSDDFLLNALKTMFKKPNVEDSIWKNQKGIYKLAKVKSWKLLESYGVHIITFINTQMIPLVERRYPLTRFTLDQMLNNVRLEVEEESEVSLELLIFVRRQQQEGYKLE
nr:hypothetical protein [Tanacetum cinerariifolium]